MARITAWLLTGESRYSVAVQGLLSSLGLSLYDVVVADFSGEGSSSHQGREGEFLHLVIVTGERIALLLNCFLDNEDPHWDAVRTVEELPTSGDGLPTIPDAMTPKQDGRRDYTLVRKVIYLGLIQAALELLDE